MVTSYCVREVVEVGGIMRAHFLTPFNYHFSVFVAVAQTWLLAREFLLSCCIHEPLRMTQHGPQCLGIVQANAHSSRPRAALSIACAPRPFYDDFADLWPELLSALAQGGIGKRHAESLAHAFGEATGKRQAVHRRPGDELPSLNLVARAPMNVEIVGEKFVQSPAQQCD